MKSIVCALLAFAALAWADERADRAAIQGVVEALANDQAGGSPKAAAGLFTDDADNQLSRLSDMDRRLLWPGGEPFSEVTAPRLAVQTIRFITADVALVDAAIAQYGSTIVVRRVPVLLVMRKEAKGWRIASLRLMADLTKML
jgi:hypothetical protein